MQVIRVCSRIATLIILDLSGFTILLVGLAHFLCFVGRHFVTLLKNCLHFTSAMDSDLLVIGHSFVKRLQVSLLRRGCTTQIVGADLGVSAQFSSVFLPRRGRSLS